MLTKSPSEVHLYPRQRTIIDINISKQKKTAELQWLVKVNERLTTDCLD